MTELEYKAALAEIAQRLGMPRVGHYWRWHLASWRPQVELCVRAKSLDPMGVHGHLVALWRVWGDMTLDDIAGLERFRQAVAAELPAHFGEWGGTPTAQIPVIAREPHGFGTGAFDDSKGT